MPTSRALLLSSLCLGLALTAGAVPERGHPAGSSWSVEPFGQLPLPFAANAGQFPAEACFHVAAPGPAMLFTEEGLVIRQGGGNGIPPAEVSVVLVGADPLRVEAGRLEKGVVNYYLGDDPERWRVGVPTHDAVHYRGAWPQVDVEYSGRTGRLKSTVRIAPGGRVEDVRLRYEGAVALRIREDGALIVQTFAGDLVEEAPVAWQLDALGRKEPVACRFRLFDGVEVGYGVGRHDPARELVLDPEIDFSTFLGGSGDEESVGFMDDGYVGGTTTSLDFPVLEAAQDSLAGGRDLFLSAVGADGGGFSFSTYIGGSGDDVATLGSRERNFVGWTTSTDFPMPAGRAHGPLGGPSDALLVRLHDYGIVHSTLIYGGSGEDVFLGHATAPRGNGTLVYGWTSSADLPADNGPLRGPSDAFWLRTLDPAVDPALLRWSRYEGGSGDERAHAVDWQIADASASWDSTLRLVGWTSSPDFPVTPGGPDDTLDGPSDGFVTEYAVEEFFDHDRLTWLGGRFFGGSGDDALLRWARDSFAGGALPPYWSIAGWTTSPDLPTTLAFQDSLGGGRDAFFGRLSESDDSVLALSYFGGSGDETLSVISEGLVVGWTDSPDLPVRDAWQPSFAGGTDGFYSRLRLQPEGYVLVQSSYMGGSGDDRLADSRGLLNGRSGCLYLTGTTNSADYPQLRPAQDDFADDDLDAFLTRVCDRPPPPGGGDWEIGDVIVRLDDIDEALEFAEAKLDALQSESGEAGEALEMIEAKLDAPPSHADLLAELLENQAALALIEAKLDAEPDLGPVLEALEMLETKADELAAELNEALERRELERLAWIEQLLHAKQCIPSLWLPEANEGWHEEARDHVAELILRAEASGDEQAHVDVARRRLAEADAALAEGAPMRACQKLSDALRALTSP